MYSVMMLKPPPSLALNIGITNLKGLFTLRVVNTSKMDVRECISISPKVDMDIHYGCHVHCKVRLLGTKKHISDNCQQSQISVPEYGLLFCSLFLYSCSWSRFAV